jgi:hypothetical protein
MSLEKVTGLSLKLAPNMGSELSTKPADSALENILGLVKTMAAFLRADSRFGGGQRDSKPTQDACQPLSLQVFGQDPGFGNFMP